MLRQPHAQVSEAQEDEVCNWIAKVTLRDRVVAGVRPLCGFSPRRAADRRPSRTRAKAIPQGPAPHPVRCRI